MPAKVSVPDSLSSLLQRFRSCFTAPGYEVFIPDHHPGFLDWDGYLANQQRIGRNNRPVAHQPGTGAVRAERQRPHPSVPFGRSR